ncbi:glycine-rich RNA-binding protein 4, mitochondrial [Trifolium repens]|nr:glycine-rich RNA-binding protein 4, mitochondrial [Trifolium repens]
MISFRQWCGGFPVVAVVGGGGSESMVVARNQWRIGSERETAVGRVKPMEEDMGGGGRRWRKIRRYSQGISCGFLHPDHFPADFGVSGNFADIFKVFPADFVTPISCGFYYFRKFRRSFKKMKLLIERNFESLSSGKTEMAFCNKIGNLLRQGATQTSQAPVSSMLNYLRHMSSSKLFIGVFLMELMTNLLGMHLQRELKLLQISFYFGRWS